MQNLFEFDYNFFKLTPNEARQMDPYQRLLLQQTWQCMEDAGYDPNTLAGSKTGVYMGVGGQNVYLKYLEQVDPDGAKYAKVSNLPAVIAGRISYCFDLKGPSLTINTSCSSSLVALHYACQDILRGTCKMAVVGSANLNLFPVQHLGIGIESDDGQTRPFDESSTGTGTGEGVLAFFIKPLEDAIKNNENIHAVIKGSDVNHDGRTIGITAPNPASQAEVIQNAWKNAGVHPETIHYIETHGTGTRLGDPIEIEGLCSAFEKYTNKKQFCAIGSVKANIGHLDGASGLAGALRAILAMKHKAYPPLANFHFANKEIVFEDTPVYPNRRLIPWHEKDAPRRCGVSSYGLSGTNCHVILEEAPQTDPHAIRSGACRMKMDILTVSAASRYSFWELVKRYRVFIRDNPEINIHDFCYTVNTGRAHLAYKCAIPFGTVQELQDRLDEILSERFENIYASEELTGDIHTDRGVVQISGQSDTASPVHAQCQMYVAGNKISWRGWYENVEKQHVPTYPFELLECIFEPKTAEEDIADFLHSIKWEKKSGAAEKEASIIKRALIFDRNSLFAQEFCQELTGRGINAERIEAAKEDHHVLDHYIKIFTAIPPGALTHLFYFSMPEAHKSFNDDLMRTILPVQELLNIVQAFSIVHGNHPLSLCMVSKLTYQVTGMESELFPQNASLHGFGRTIRYDIPTISTITIDIDESTTPMELLENICDPDWPRMVAVRHQERYVQTLGEYQTALPENCQSQDAIRKGGVYIITGGAGGVGLSLAEQMAKTCPVQLILLQRRQFPDRETWMKEVKVNEDPEMREVLGKMIYIESLGSRVSCVQVNICCYDDVETVFGDIRKTYGAIHGIVHAAGIADAHSVFRLDETILEQVLSPKTTGTMNVFEATKQDDLDFAVLCSSVSSLDAVKGQGAYTAANAFLDAFAAYARMQGKNYQCINWPTWAHVGMAKHIDETSETMIFQPIQKHRAAMLFERVIKDRCPSVVLGKINADMMKAGYGGFMTNETSSRDDGKKKESLHALKKSRGDGETVADHVARIWQGVLGLENADRKKSFLELGGDSILAIRLFREIDRVYPNVICMADIYTYASIDALTQYMQAKTVVPETENLDVLLDAFETGDISLENALDAMDHMI